MKLKSDGFKIKSLLWFLVTIAMLAVDRITKMHISSTMDLGEKIEVIDSFFYITHHTNTGAAWGLLGGMNLTRVLGVLSIVVSIIIIFLFLRFDKWPIHLSFAMIISGALGNAYGRIIHAEVTDFLDFYIFGYDFPIFNVADIMVTVGTAILVVYIIFFYREPAKAVEPADKEDGK